MATATQTMTAPAESKMEPATKPEGPTGEFSGNIKVSQKPPSKSDLEKVANLPVLDRNNKSFPFKHLLAGGDKGASRVLILFVRHFFCGNCQEYLRTLCSSVTAEDLLNLSTPTEIIVIGCGQPDLIQFYADTTACPFPIYADPTKKLYSLLGMTRTLSLGPSAPEYMQQPLLQAMLKSVTQVLGSGRKLFKGGDYWQVGGEFLFEGGQARWCHRMANTRDHAEVPELRRQLGLDDARPPMRKRWSLNPAGLGRSLSGKRRSLSSKRQSWSRSQSRTRGSMDKVKEEKMARKGDGASVEGEKKVEGASIAEEKKTAVGAEGAKVDVSAEDFAKQSAEATKVEEVPAATATAA